MAMRIFDYFHTQTGNNQAAYRYMSNRFTTNRFGMFLPVANQI